MRKITNHISVLVCSLFLTVVFSGCEKEDKVEPVKESAGVNVTSRVFSVPSWAYSSPVHYASLSVPELTADNVDKAAVLVYINLAGSNWFALPYTQYDSPYNYYMGFSAGVGNVQITWFYDSSLSTGDDPNTYFGASVRCKVVVIPPQAQRLHPKVDYKNYKEVEEAFGLE
jgi:hypothetical protein